MKQTTKIVNRMIAATSLLIIISVFFAVRGFSVIRETTTASSHDFLLQAIQYVTKGVQISMESRQQSLSYLSINDKWTKADEPEELMNNQHSLMTFFTSLNGESDILIYTDNLGKPLSAISWGGTNSQILPVNDSVANSYLKADPSLEEMLKQTQTEQNSDSYFINSKAYLNFYHAIKNSKDVIVGYLILPLKLEAFYKNLIQDFELEYKGYPIMKDQSMKVVMHPVKEQIGLNIAKGRKEIYPTLDFGDLERLENYQLKHNQGSLTYQSYWWDEEKPRRVEKIGSFKWLNVGMARWVISINADYRERNDEITNFVIVISCALLLLLLQIGIFYLFLRNFRKQEKIEEENKRLIMKHEQQKKQHKLEWKLSQQNKMETVGLLTTSIIHDMNNFLAPIIGNLELLMLEYEDQPLLKGELQEVFQSAQRGQKLLSNVLRFSKSSQSKQELVDISLAITGATQLIGGIIPRKTPLTFEIEENIGLVYLEEIDLQNLIYNLVTNAYQAVKRNVGQPHISVTAKKTKASNGSFLTLEIADNGPGIPLDIQEKIFEPFFTTKPADEGIGLGLFAVASIIEKYNWQLNLQSCSKGTIFSIIIPLIADENEED